MLAWVRCFWNSSVWDGFMSAWARFNATVIELWGFRASSVMWSVVSHSAWLHLALYVSRHRGAEKQANSKCADRKLVRLQLCWTQWCVLAHGRRPAPAFQPIPELHTTGYVTVMWFEKERKKRLWKEGSLRPWWDSCQNHCFASRISASRSDYWAM